MNNTSLGITFHSCNEFLRVVSWWVCQYKPTSLPRVASRTVLHLGKLQPSNIGLRSKWLTLFLTLLSRNTKWGGRLSTVDLLIKVARLVKKVNNIFCIKRCLSKLVSARRLTVLSLSPQLLFPDFIFARKSGACSSGAPFGDSK